jgi:phosphoglycolate phosphatase-like HAD superfamily hydrolase
VEFEAALAEELERAPTQFRETPGATSLVAHLRANGWSFAFATGGWGRTARMKLSAAGLPPNALVASSDDSPDRSAIFSLAHERASPQGAGPVVLVGDGAWDVKVAMELGWSFVGIGSGRQEDVLRSAGAAAVVADFMDCEKVVELLRTSAIARSTASTK